MGKASNTIILNGKPYDAVTGKAIKSAGKKPINTPASARGKVIDGFVRSKAIPKNPVVRKTDKSKTLMRSVVSKPSVKNTNSRKKASIHKPKTSNPAREARAVAAKKSSLIRKFSPSVTGTFSEFKQIRKPFTSTEKIKSTSSNVKHSGSDNKPLDSSQLAKTEDKFKHAINNANSHKQAKIKKPKLRHRTAQKLKISPAMMNALIVVLIAGIIGTYVAVNNVPNISMRLAAARSGVDASLPGYQPSGFNIKGPISYQAGQVLVNFGSNTDDRTYSVKQTRSEWDSESLLKNHVATNNRAYQTYQESGRTIYIYEGSNASWVDRGIWFEIKGEESLSSDQLIRIANSL